MKIYSTDGSYTENVRDTEFGWFIDDLTTDNDDSDEDNVKKEPQKNKTIRDNKSSVMLNPAIEVYGVEDAIECKEITENEMQKRHHISRENVTIDSQSPTREEIASLIEPFSIESGTLLSVVSNAKLLTYKSKYLQLFIAARASAYRFLIKDKEEIKKLVEELKLNEIANSPVSLLLEVIFTDKSSPIDYFLFNTKGNDTGALLRSLLRQQTQDVLIKNKSETDSGVDDSISSSNSEMRNEILEIHQSFENMNTKVERLIEKAEKLEKDLIQTTYLDDLLHLLNGNIEKVKNIKLPFQAFTKNMKEEEENVNFII